MQAPNTGWKSAPRINISPSTFGVADFLHLGRYNYVQAERGLRPHRHPGAMEICYLVRGRQTYEVSGEHFALTGGDLFVTFPGEVHSTAQLPQEKGVLYWIILRLSGTRRFLGLPGPEAAALEDSLRSLPSRMFRGNRHLASLLDGLMQTGLAEPDPLTPLRLRAQLIAYLLEVIASAGEKPTAHGSRAKPLGKVLSHIRNNLDEPLTIPELAAIAGLSIPQFQNRFKRQFGVPPGEYVLRAKLEEACHRLRNTDQSITRIGLDLGFGSSQYFATTFRKFTLRTPSGYRSEAKARPAPARTGNRD